jgi:AcrR family transcriptional regulator
MITPVRPRADFAKAQRRCNQVLDAAARCFARNGFQGASIAQISREAGMSGGHIYTYFDSKDAIILALVERQSGHVAALLREFATSDDPLQSVVDNVERHIENTLDPQVWHLMLEIFAEAARNPVVAARLRAHEDASFSRMRELVKAGRERLDLPVDEVLLDARIDAMIASFQGVAIRALHRTRMDRKGLAEALRVSLRALLMT